MPDWFLEKSPYKNVPLLEYGDDRVWESAIINEYLEDVFPEPSLMPKDPLKKALVRIFIDFANTRFIRAFYKLLKAQESYEQEKCSEEFKEHLIFMEKEGIGKFAGPYWLGANMTLVDVTFYPWFERWPVIKHYRDFAVPEECKLLKQWQQIMSERESVKSICNASEFYISEYARYANA